MFGSFTGLSFQGLLFGILIALLYYFSFDKAIDIFTSRSTTTNMCMNIPYLLLDEDNVNTHENPEFTSCFNFRKNELAKLDKNKFIFLMVIGIFGIIIASMIQPKAIKIGVGIGGITSIIAAILMKK